MSWSRQKEEHDVTIFRNQEKSASIQHVRIHRRQIHPGFGAIGIEIATQDKELQRYFSQHGWKNEDDKYSLSDFKCSNIDHLKMIFDLLANEDRSINIPLKFQMFLEANQAITLHGSAVYKRTNIIDDIFLPDLLYKPNKKLVAIAIDRAERAAKMPPNNPSTNSEEQFENIGEPIIYKLYGMPNGQAIMKQMLEEKRKQEKKQNNPDATIFYLAEYLFESYQNGENFVEISDVLRAYAAIPKDSPYIEVANTRLLQFLEAYSALLIEQEENENKDDFLERRQNRLEGILGLALQLKAQHIIDKTFDQLCGNNGDQPELVNVNGDMKDLIEHAEIIATLNNKINTISSQLIQVIQTTPIQGLSKTQTPFLFSIKHLQPMFFKLAKSVSDATPPQEFNPTFNDAMDSATEQAIHEFKAFFDKELATDKSSNAEIKEDASTAILRLIEQKAQQVDSLKNELSRVYSPRPKL